MLSSVAGASLKSSARSDEFPASVDGWDITVPSRTDALTSIAAAIQQGVGFSVCTLNLDHLVKLRASAAFREAYRAAAFVTADGAPVAWLARRGGAKVELATGADLVVPLAVKAAEIRCGVYLFGSTPHVLETAGQVLINAGDGSLKISGRASPSGQFDPNGPEADAAIEQIKASGAGLCFLALGAPKQEIFAARALARGANVGFVSIGAGLDFLTGQQVRAPMVFRSLGVEWIWRLAQNPQRMFKRYLDCALVLGDIVIVAPLRQRLAALIGPPSRPVGGLS
jgi:exopolysaccharide biosynthesis WecB/TagA/CpsF family protein